MRKSIPKPKRKTWHDRRCHHGNPPVCRITYDFIHCDDPKCWDEVLLHVGFLPRTRLREAAPDLLEALKDVVAGLEQFIHDPDTAPRVIHARAAIAKAEERPYLRGDGRAD